MWVSQVLGHQDPALTLRTYAHVLERENDDMGFFEAGSNIRDDPGQEDSVKFVSSWKCGDPGAIRTRDPQLRRLFRESCNLPVLLRYSENLVRSGSARRCQEVP
jgi:hypothetical protein